MKLSLAPGDLSHPGLSSRPGPGLHFTRNCSLHACRSCHAPGLLGNYEMRFSQDSALGSGAGGWGVVSLGRTSDDILTLSTVEAFLK